MIGTAPEERPRITADLLNGATAAALPNLHDKKVLLVGAGGIGCELLKNLVLTGFHHITVVDMDTIELSNLNRQFLFTKADIGGHKARVACEAIQRLYPGVRVQLEARVCDVRTMTVSDFLSFDVVLSALDNLEARRHVNLQAVMAGRPVVESGTAGYQGQVGCWRAGRECFDCRHHSPPTTFPVCTIRATPTKMIHCVVWGKEYLLGRLFGDGDGNVGDIDSIDSAVVKEALLREERAFDEIKQEQDDHQFATKLIQKLYNTDILETLRNVEMWKDKPSTPTPLACFDQTPVDLVADRMSEWSVSQWLHCFHTTAISLRSRRQPVLFDKDDDTVMAFVAAAANLRATVFKCEPRTVSLFKAKEMAGNIIPAVATTNSIAAALAALLAVGCFMAVEAADKADCVGNVYITHGSTSRLLTKERLQEGELSCAVCNTTRIHVWCQLSLSLSSLLSKLPVNMQTDDGVMVLSKGRLLYDSMDMNASVSEKTLNDFGIQFGDIVTIEADSYDRPILVAILNGALGDVGDVGDVGEGDVKAVVTYTAVPVPQPAEPAEQEQEQPQKKHKRESDSDTEQSAKAIRVDEDDDLILLQ